MQLGRNSSPQTNNAGNVPVLQIRLPATAAARAYMRLLPPRCSSLCRPQRIAEGYLQVELHLAAQEGVIDMGNLSQALLQMTDGFAVGRARRRLFARVVP
jgi:hypothetical protein